MTNLAKTPTAATARGSLYIDIGGHRILKLTGSENFQVWKTKITLAFRHLKFFKYISGEFTKPVQPNRPADVPEIAPPDEAEEIRNRREHYEASLASYIADMEEWDKDYDTVMYHLIDSLSDAIQVRVKDMTEPDKIWAWIHSQYKTMGTGTILSHRARFYQLKWDGVKDPIHFFDMLEAEAAPFRDITTNVNLGLIDIFQVTCTGMPASYLTTLSTLYHQTNLEDDGVTPEILRYYQTHLRDEWNNKKNQATSYVNAYGSNMSAYAATAFTDGPDEQPRVWLGKWNGAPCRECAKMHPTYSCHQKYPHLRGQWLAARAQQVASGAANSYNNRNQNGKGNGNGYGGFQNGQKNQNGRGFQYPAGQQNNQQNNNNGSQGNIQIANPRRQPHDSVFMADFTSFTAQKGLDHLRGPDGRMPFIIDSGTTEHCATDKREFISLSIYDKPRVCVVGGQYELAVHGEGSVLINHDVLGKATRTIFTNVMFCPKMGVNLLSTTALMRKGLDILFKASSGKSFVIDENGKVVLTASNRFRQNVVDYAVTSAIHADDPAIALVNSVTASAEAYQVSQHDLPEISVPTAALIHQRLAHAGIDKLRLMGFDLDHYGACEPCFKAKAKRQRSTEPSTLANEVYEKLHVDTCGPIEPPAIESTHIYFNVWIDDKTRYMTWQGLLSKDQVYEKSHNFLSTIQKDGYKVFTIRTDHGGEFTSDNMQTMANKMNIDLTFSSVGTPEQNGVAERSFRTIIAAIKCFLFNSGLPECFWEVAGIYATTIINRLPRKILKNKSPYEVFTGEVPNTHHFRVFGCNAYCQIKVEQPKLAEETRTCAFVGIAGDNQYRVFDLDRNMFFLTRDVTFDEANFSEARRIYAAYHDLEVDDPRDKDYDPDGDDYESMFTMLCANHGYAQPG